jgi:5-methyltetrahydrofolate--homocysteine methyltransferase
MITLRWLHWQTGFANFYEYLHEKVKKSGSPSQGWGFNYTVSRCETYKGIAQFIPCPDHLEKPTIWKLLNV